MIKANTLCFASDQNIALFWYFLGVIAFLLYFLPTLVARNKKHFWAIFFLNLFLGWTLLGWLGALIWAILSTNITGWIYTCAKCSYKTSLRQKVIIYVCPQCRYENNYQINRIENKDNLEQIRTSSIPENNNNPSFQEWKEKYPHKTINDYYAANSIIYRPSTIETNSYTNSEFQKPNQSNTVTSSKSIIIALIVVCLIVLIAVLTNPNQERHKEVIKNKLNSFLKKSMKDNLKETSNDWDQAGQSLGIMIGGAIVDRVIDNLISTDNYVLFSTTKITWNGQTKIIGIGILGNVFVIKQLDEYLNNGLLNNQNDSFNGKTLTALDFLGTYKTSDGYTFLQLNSNNSFILSVNLCDGVGKDSGSFEINDNKIYFKVYSKDYSGFSGDKVMHYVMEIISNSKLKYISEDLACSPIRDSIFEKINN